MWTYDPIGETLRFLKELAILLVVGVGICIIASAIQESSTPLANYYLSGAVMFSLSIGRALERWFNR